MTHAETLAARLGRSNPQTQNDLAAMLYGLPLQSFVMLTNGAWLLAFDDQSHAYVNLESHTVQTRTDGHEAPRTPSITPDTP